MTEVHQPVQRTEVPHVDPPPILTVSDLEVAYGPTQVIFGISLEVAEGGLCCLMGRNGVGKSTLLQTIVGLQPAKRGTISLGWQEITKTAPYNRTKAGIAYVPQGREAFPYLTVFENLRVVAEASEKSGAAGHRARRWSASRGCARSSTGRPAS